MVHAPALTQPHSRPKRQRTWSLRQWTSAQRLPAAGTRRVTARGRRDSVDASAPEADTPGDSPTKAPAETADAAEPAAAAAPASHEPEVTKRLSVVRSRAGTRSATRAPTAKLCAQCIRLLVCAIAVGLLWVTMLAYAKDIVFYFVQRPDGVRARCATDVPL